MKRRSTALRELVILRVAVLNGADYQIAGPVLASSRAWTDLMPRT